MELQVHLIQGLLHVLNVNRSHFHQAVAMPKFMEGSVHLSLRRAQPTEPRSLRIMLRTDNAVINREYKDG